MLPERQAIKICLSVDGEPFGKLIKDPREGKPYLAYDRCEPQPKGIMHRMQDSVTKEEPKDNQPEHNHHPVGVDLARCDGYFP